MDVYDGFESCVLSVVHNFGNTVEPCGVYAVVGCGSEMPEPCHRNAYVVESGGCDTVEKRLRGRFVAPCCFGCYAVFIGVELIAEIPSRTHGPGVLQRCDAVGGFCLLLFLFPGRA